MKQSSYILNWGNSLLEMLPSKALFLPQKNAILICDIHLGKGEYFQQNGIPLTNYSDEKNLLRIRNIVQKYNPNKLIILGDLFHSKYSISKSLKSKVEILSENLNIEIQLIAGNHDKGCEVKNITFLDNKKFQNLIFTHEPLDKQKDNVLNICGHYHPKIYLRNSKDKLSFPCFAMDESKNILYMPAFGDLTGGYPCKKSFKKWAIISEKKIIKV